MERFGGGKNGKANRRSGGEGGVLDGPTPGHDPKPFFNERFFSQRDLRKFAAAAGSQTICVFVVPFFRQAEPSAAKALPPVAAKRV